jgi:hypothetical protein
MKQLMTVGVVAVAMAAGAAQTPAGQRPADQQPRQQVAQAVPEGEVTLGTVRIPRAVTADGKPLPAGTYQVRLTGQAAQPEVVGQRPDLNRWVDFIQGGQVRGREVVSVIPADEIQAVAQTTPPRPGSSRVEMLRGGDYLRVWINRAGTHYLIHLPPA